MKISVTIITFNEEKNIARAIESARFADEIVVVDSYSTDKTVEIAKSLGAKVISSPFAGFGQQKNLATYHALGPWIFSLDADEEISPDLQLSIQKAILNEQPIAYTINRRTNFCGKWIYHGGWYPDRLIRLYLKKEARWTTPEVHEEVKLYKKGATPLLKGELNHYSFNTIEDQIRRNIKYAKLGAKALVQKKRAITLLHLLFKPIGKFIECYFIKLGLLDGRAGFIIALNAAHSIYMKYLFAISKEY